MTSEARRGGTVAGLLAEIDVAHRLAREVDRPDLAERLRQAADRLRADDVAVAGHRPISLARALVAMATHTTTGSPAGSPLPAGSLAAAGGEAAERLRRLLEPPAPLSRVHRAALAVGFVVLALAPAALLLAAQVFPVLGMCPTLPS